MSETPAKPMSDDRLRDVERRLSDVIARFDAGFTHEVSDERAALNDLVAEVRRLWALFPDPEADASLCEGVANHVWREAKDDLNALAARIRATREP